MKKLLLLAFLLCGIQALASPGYWQQKVDYDINVSLDTNGHYLRGFVAITYRNQSPDTLRQMYMHLWPRAYSTTMSPFAKQHFENGAKDFHTASREDWGNMDSLNIMVNGKPMMNPAYFYASEEVLRFDIEPLAPGRSLTITTPFRVKIPIVFSRMGHTEGIYEITQWFPKVALYDKNGWNPMPYLDLGEFYSDFGKYKVNITLPADYKVAATGLLQTEEELEWLDEIISKTEDEANIERRSGTKTLTYTADSVVDFAWFASKDYLIRRSEVKLPSGRTVKTYAYYPPSVLSRRERRGTVTIGGEINRDGWKDAVKAVDSGVWYYSQWVGEYPYPHATAVYGGLKAGGGMEYPMVTTIGMKSGITEVIVHEVGHNWFMGILAFNERRYPWMDEGINTYYDNRFGSRPRLNTTSAYRQFSSLMGLLAGVESQAYVFQQGRNMSQAGDRPSPEYTNINYGAIIYMQVPDALAALADYLGQEQFDHTMHVFFEEWKFKHPTPEDIREVFERETGEDLGWFFDGYLAGKSMNVEVKKFNPETGEVVLKNNGEVAAPVKLYSIQLTQNNPQSGEVLNGDSVSAENTLEGRAGNMGIMEPFWIPGFKGDTTLTLPQGAENADAIFADYGPLFIDRNWHDNIAYAGGLTELFQRPQIRLFNFINDPFRSEISIEPALNFNTADGFGLGLAFHNPFYPAPRHQWAVVPLFSFGSQQLNGIASYRYHRTGTGEMNRTKFMAGVNARTFSYKHLEGFPRFREEIDRYTRISPYITFEVRGNEIRNSAIHSFNINPSYVEDASGDNIFTRITYSYEKDWTYQSLKFRPGFINSSQRAFVSSIFPSKYSQVEAELNWSASLIQWLPFFKKKKSVFVRLYGGYTVASEGPLGNARFRAAGERGYFDLAYEDIYFSREYDDRLFSRQIYPERSFMKTARTPRATIGSNIGMVAANFRLALPFGIPLDVFTDVAIFPFDRNNFNEGTFYVGGIALPIVRDYVEVYFPLVYSEQYGGIDSQPYGKQITWMLRLDKLTPWKLLTDWRLF